MQSQGPTSEDAGLIGGIGGGNAGLGDD